MNPSSNHRGGYSSRKIAVADQLDTTSRPADVCNQSFMARPVKHDHNQVFHIASHAPCDVFQVVFDRRIEIDGMLARGTYDDFFHIAVGRVQEAAKTVIAPGAPVAHRFVPSRGSTAISTSGTSVPSGNSAPTLSPM